MKTNKEKYCEMIDALRTFDNGFHIPIVKQIEPYVDELIESIKFTIEVFCDSCPNNIKKECKDYSGCYCLKVMKNLTKDM
jgi:hypothetical protein